MSNPCCLVLLIYDKLKISFNFFQLPAHNPFVPPSAITQVMLISNPQKKLVGLKYVISYMIDGEPQTEMGETDKLPI